MSIIEFSIFYWIYWEIYFNQHVLADATTPIMTRLINSNPQKSASAPLEPIRKFKTAQNYEDSYLLSEINRFSNPNEVHDNEIEYNINHVSSRSVKFEFRYTLSTRQF